MYRRPVESCSVSFDEIRVAVAVNLILVHTCDSLPPGEHFPKLRDAFSFQKFPVSVRTLQLGNRVDQLSLCHLIPRFGSPLRLHHTIRYGSGFVSKNPEIFSEFLTQSNILRGFALISCRFCTENFPFSFPHARHQRFVLYFGSRWKLNSLLQLGQTPNQLP